jgi:hypothetical protein
MGKKIIFTINISGIIIPSYVIVLLYFRPQAVGRNEIGIPIFGAVTQKMKRAVYTRMVGSSPSTSFYVCFNS